MYITHISAQTHYSSSAPPVTIHLTQSLCYSSMYDDDCSLLPLVAPPTKRQRTCRRELVACPVATPARNTRKHTDAQFPRTYLISKAHGSSHAITGSLIIKSAHFLCDDMTPNEQHQIMRMPPNLQRTLYILRCTIWRCMICMVNPNHKHTPQMHKSCSYIDACTSGLCSFRTSDTNITSASVVSAIMYYVTNV
jgi:hypothetical protein